MTLGYRRLLKQKYFDPHSKVEFGRFLNETLERGIYKHDHADVYGNQISEELFGRAMKYAKIDRERIKVVTKSGILVEKLFNGSKYKVYNNNIEYIRKSIDHALSRLGCEYIDEYFLHRVDYTQDISDVIFELDSIQKTGKIRSYGVCIPDKRSYGVSINNFSLFHIDCSLEKLDFLTDYSINNLLSIGNVAIYKPFNEGKIFNTIDSDVILSSLFDYLCNKYSLERSGIISSFFITCDKRLEIIAGSFNLSRIIQISKGERVTLEPFDFYKILNAFQKLN
jgi:predicted oxidoreductase